MDFKIFKNNIIELFPEFVNSLNEDYEEDYYNSFIGDLGLYLLDSISKNKSIAKNYLINFNNFYNENYSDKDLRNKLNVNALEILTDTYLCQKLCLEIFTGKCFETFRYYLDFLYQDLTKNK